MSFLLNETSDGRIKQVVLVADEDLMLRRRERLLRAG
jgi:hypothetical protein